MEDEYASPFASVPAADGGYVPRDPKLRIRNNENLFALRETAKALGFSSHKKLTHMFGYKLMEDDAAASALLSTGIMASPQISVTQDAVSQPAGATAGGVPGHVSHASL